MDARHYGRQEGITQGRSEGIQVGIAQGRSEGIAQGFADGSYKTKIETARVMRGLNYPVGDIRKISELSKEEIERL